MDFRILGPMEVWDGARSLPLPAGRGRALLALLALHPGEVVAADRLIDELWGEHPPATANTVIQGLVSRLRKELEPGRPPGIPATILRTVGTGYLLAIEPDAVDAQRFQHLLVQARNAAPGTRRALIAEALGLWRGPALAEFVYEPFAQRAVTALGELRLVAIEDRIDAELSLGEHRELVAEIERLVEEYPFRERLRGLLMLALYRAGRQADALAAYRRARHALLEELGVEPGPELKSLHQAILRHDTALGPRPREITAQRWLPLERRTVTVVYTDLRPMAEPGTDPEAVNRYGAQVLDAATEVFRRHGGRVVPILGDSVVALFGLPVAHEDDPIRAVRAAVELRTAAEALSRTSEFTFSPKSGIETGVIIVGGADDIAYGSLVTTAARLQQAASDGDVLVGAVTQRLIRGVVVVKPADDIAVNGLGGSVALGRVLDVVPEAAALVRRFDTPMRGRQSEVTQLRPVPAHGPLWRSMPGDNSRRGRHREVAGNRGVRRNTRCRRSGDHRGMPCVRRGHHVLAVA